ncbi:hypothetical protein Tco_0189300 [Tanacetum coccineum]
MNANPLVLVAATKQYPNTYPQAPPTLKPYKTHESTLRQTTSTKLHASTINKGKEIVKTPSPPSESTFEEDNDEEQTQRDKQIQKMTVAENMETDIYDEHKEQELEAHYMYMKKIQEVLTTTDDNSRPTFDTEPLEKVDINITPDSLDMYTNIGEADQHAEEPKDERVLLASLIAN